MPGNGFCAKNMAVVIAMLDILQLQDGHRIRFYKFPKIKNCAKKQVVSLRNASAAHLANLCVAPFEKRCII